MATELEVNWHDLADELDVSEGIYSKISETIGRLSTHHLPTAEHSMRVGITAVRIGQHRGLPLKPLFYGGSLHDRGKLNVPLERLTKVSEWTDQDRLALMNHPHDGYKATAAEGMVVTAGLIVRHHTFQPNAYPSVLPEAPPYMQDSFQDCARTIALADFYDAAHRTNSAGGLTGDEIQAKVLAHNPDLHGLIGELYDSGVFSTTERPY